MADFLIRVQDTLFCPHGGPLQIMPQNAKVLVQGLPLATAQDQFVVSGGPFTVPPSTPQPCVTATFAPAVKVLLVRKPAVLKSSVAVCEAAPKIPQGPPTVAVTQLKVMGL